MGAEVRNGNSGGWEERWIAGCIRWPAAAGAGRDHIGAHRLRGESYFYPYCLNLKFMQDILE